MFQLMEDLHNAYHLRGIALSGYWMDEGVQRARDAGFAAHLIKPVDFQQLQQTVSGVMERSVLIRAAAPSLRFAAKVVWSRRAESHRYHCKG